MAATCIVCLGDLRGGDAEAANSDVPAATNGSLGGAGAAAAGHEGEFHHKASENDSEEIIAHLLPCGHNLHEECLKPWLGRANSCPICRAQFNMVELSDSIGGPVTSSYAVNNKQQVADIDPTLTIDEDLEDDLEDEGPEPCAMCGSCNPSSEFIDCEGCDKPYHLFCVGENSVPTQGWLCFDCRRSSELRRRPGLRARPNRRRQADADTRTWANIWREVATRANFDLDFPHAETSEEQRNIEAAERREFRAWQRRFDIADRQHGNNRFRQAATALVQPQPQARPAPESQEEIMAWNAFEKIRESQEGTAPRNSRKRKSAPASPASPQLDTGRKLKRPRQSTRRTQAEPGESSADAAGESSAKGPSPGSTRPPNRDGVNGANGGSSFLRALLKEVESHPTPNYSSGSEDQQDSTAPQEGASSPRMSSRGASPSSDLASPTATTPRPSSPAPPLTSNIMPIFPPAPEFSPFSPAEEDSIERARARRRPNHHSSPLASPTRTADASPTRSNMSYATKMEIQKMVKAVLKPHYPDKINKDEYTDINRDVSRKLYDQVGDAEGLANEKTRTTWQKVAAEEVDRAIKALREEAPHPEPATAAAAS